MTNKPGNLEREVIRSSVMPSLKYSCCGSPLMLVKGRTAIDGTLGSGKAGCWVGGIDAVVVGGRRERYCTNMMVAAIIASPAIEKMPRRTYLRGTCCVLLPGLVSAPGSVRTRNTRTGRAMFFTSCSPA